MKGTVSPELRTILRNPEMRRRFISGFLDADHSRNATIDLGNNENIVIRRFSSAEDVSSSKKNRRKSRNIFQILAGK